MIERMQQRVGAILQTLIDAARGLDHGAWVPMKLMYPEADVPALLDLLASDARFTTPPLPASPWPAPATAIRRSSRREGP